MKRILKGSSFFWALLKMNMLPLILLTLVITTFSAVRFAASLNVETQNGLVNLSRTVVTLYDTVYEGEYHTVEKDGTFYLMKGDHTINGNFAIIDSIKEKTGVDISVFYQDTRVITTIRTDKGERVIGTKANDTVVQDVLRGGQPHFYASTMVEDVRYFSYYEPLYDADGACIGMIFLGKPSAEVERLVVSSLSPIIIFGLLTMLIACFVTIRFSGRLVSAIRKMELFLVAIAKGDLHEEFDQDVLARRDELGEMSRYLIKMQKSLQKLVEQDILTGLYNRRSGEKILKRVCDNYAKNGTPFCVAIGDVDHFKNVNDTYGHECGDVALTELSSRMKEHMRGRGFVARWGGEEMLLIYDGVHLDTAVTYMQDLLESIRTKPIAYGDVELNVTMTFGLTEGNGDKIEHIVRDADEKLYQGKNSGRNKIVC
ncbi:MAG: diguanylate cyclase [Lachnospiraceae bacterium]|nr:diguanylate cyclase [Lachnospiraceae bacterium]MDE7358981.1 diguanylate cyclase [Lachnospiraceae bacterium]